MEIGFDAYNSIGNKDFKNKELVILENNAHQGYLEGKELFISTFRKFVNGL